MNNRPEILIGIIGLGTDLAEETAFGIEEEGCLFSIYEAESEEDIRFSDTGVTVVISAHVDIYYKEASRVICIAGETDLSKEAARKAGHMAAKLL